MDTKQLLQRLGHTQLAADCYVVLAKRQAATIRHVASEIQMSRISVYRALQRLKGAGLVVSFKVRIPGQVLYRAVPLESVIRRQFRLR